MKTKEKIFPKKSQQAGVNWLISIALIFFSNAITGMHANPLVNITFALIDIVGVVGFFTYPVWYIVLKIKENKKSRSEKSK